MFIHTTTYLHIYTKQVMVFFVVHYFVSFDIAIYYGFSLLHTFSLVLQPRMSTYIRITDWIYIQSIIKTITAWPRKEEIFTLH
jgi:hypothetical protein